jgi:antitoxin HicB
MTKKNFPWGQTLDGFLDTEGMREAAKAAAVTRLVAWQLAQEMERQGITKAALAERMHTSRAQVDGILKAKATCENRKPWVLGDAGDIDVGAQRQPTSLPRLA